MCHDLPSIAYMFIIRRTSAPVHASRFGSAMIFSMSVVLREVSWENPGPVMADAGRFARRRET
jgi:hypothetical protein